MTTEQKAELIEKTVLFAQTPENLLRQLAEYAVIAEFPAGQVISEIIPEDHNFYLLLSGKIVVESDGVQWSVLQAGNLFGPPLYPHNHLKKLILKSVLPSVLVVFSFPQTNEARAAEIFLLHKMVRHFASMPEAGFYMNELEDESPAAMVRRLQNTQEHLFSIYSHDFRSPVASMISVLSLLKSEMEAGTPENELQSLLDSLIELSDVHLKMIENLRLWSELRAGRKKIIFQRQSIRELVQNVIYSEAEAFESKSIKLTLGAFGDKLFETNPPLFQAILQEFLSNARKFSYPGSSVYLNVAVNGHEAIISVTDEGRGITNTRAANLLKTGKNFSEYGTAYEAGTGLGLLIAKEMAGLIGGHINFESETGKGSTFTLRLDTVLQD